MFPFVCGLKLETPCNQLPPSPKFKLDDWTICQLRRELVTEQDKVFKLKLQHKVSQVKNLKISQRRRLHPNRVAFHHRLTGLKVPPERS